MKLLLDENLPYQMRPLLIPMHEPFTVGFMKWKGISNGKLLALAAAYGFDALLTTDKGIAYQQNQANLPCSVVLMQASDNKLATIKFIVPALLKALQTLPAHSFIRV